MTALTSELILGCLSADEARIRRLLSGVSGQADFASEVVQESLYHGVFPLVALALESVVPGSDVASSVAAELPARLAHNLRLEAMAAEAVTLLEEAGIACAVFKGPALSHGYYESPNQRLYGDVDLLVSPSDFVRSGELLSGAGYHRVGEHLESVLERGYGEAAFGKAHGQAIDLHWHLMREANVRSAFGVRTSDLLSRATKLPMHGRALPVLDPTDELLAVATHACFDGAYRLGWLVDLARIADSGNVDWARLSEYTTRTGTGLAVQVMLDRAQRAIGPITAQQLQHYSTWRALLGSVEWVRPAARSFRRIGRGGVVFRATRTSTVSSAKALMGLAFSEALRPLLTDRRHRWRRSRGSRL